MKKYAMLCLSLTLVAIFGTGCMTSAQLDADLTTALAKEDQAQSLIHSLEVGATAMLPSIPEPDRAKYQDLLQDLVGKADLIFQEKDNAILSAKQQNQERFDLLPFLVRWGGVIQELVDLGRSLKVQKSLLDAGQAKAIRYKAGLP